MRLALAPLSLVVAMTACKGDPPPASDTGTSTGEPTGTTAMDPGATTNVTTAPPVTTVDPDDTTFGPGCGPDPCPEMCGRECQSTATCLASVWMCECDCAGTTGGDPCDVIDAAIDAWVAGSEMPAVDCGSPGPDDDPFAWQTVHDCSSIQASNQSGLRATWTLADGIEPFQYGVAGRVGRVYELTWLERSSDAVVAYACTNLVATPDCTVDVGEPCLTCEGQTELEVICGEAGGSSGGSSGSGGSSSSGG